MATEGREVPFEDLPPWEEKDVMTYPMVWTCPATGQRSFQVHPVPVYKLRLRTSPDGPETIVTDLAEIRALLHRLQRPAIAPQYVWAPAYSPGDLVIFYNRGEWTEPGCESFEHSARWSWLIEGSRLRGLWCTQRCTILRVSGAVVCI